MKIFNSFKEIFGPSIFTKGLQKYKQGQFEESKKLILRAGRWMPILENDGFFQTSLLLVESNLGKNISNSQFSEALESLADSSYRNTGDYSIIVEELKHKIKGIT